MRTLVILRHAKSSWALPGVEDFDRPLNEKGLTALPAMAMWLSKMVTPDHILCSSALRTQQTLEGYKSAFSGAISTSVERNLYLASSEKTLAAARHFSDAVSTALIIGHNPGLHDTALQILSADERSRSKGLRSAFPTCAAAIINLPITSWSKIEWNNGTLNAYMTPKLLARSDK